MFITRKRLSRRALLRGAGAALALPALDSMTPAFAGPDAGGGPTRLLFSYRPSGAIMSEWTPKAAGRDYEFSQILKPLEGFRNDITVLTGLGHREAESNGDGAGAHGRAGAAYLTGVRCKKQADRIFMQGFRRIRSRRADGKPRRASRLSSGVATIPGSSAPAIQV
jgi:hypothetical protein